VIITAVYGDEGVLARVLPPQQPIFEDGRIEEHNSAFVAQVTKV